MCIPLTFTIQIYEILGSHGSEYEGDGFLGYRAV
jgi:hypothetical protein